MIASVIEHVRVPVFIMVRPRAGHFVFSDDELLVMRREIEMARASGIAGIVTGVLRSDRTIDVERTRQLVETAADLPVTFHRAFDLVKDMSEALDQLIAAGVRRVLTSGGAATALEGASAIARLVDQAGGRIRVMAGGGVRENNVRELIARTHVAEIHTGVSRMVGADPWPRHPGVGIARRSPEDEWAWREVEEEEMRRVVASAKSAPRV